MGGDYAECWSFSVANLKTDSFHGASSGMPAGVVAGGDGCAKTGGMDAAASGARARHRTLMARKAISHGWRRSRHCEAPAPFRGGPKQPRAPRWRVLPCFRRLARRKRRHQRRLRVAIVRVRIEIDKPTPLFHLAPKYNAFQTTATRVALGLTRPGGETSGVPRQRPSLAQPTHGFATSLA